jgi:predicted kinase
LSGCLASSRIDPGKEQTGSTNRSRSAQVPQKVIDRMIDRLEIPNITEAQQVHWIDTY